MKLNTSDLGNGQVPDYFSAASWSPLNTLPAAWLHHPSN